MTDRPETSTVRSALTIRAAADRLDRVPVGEEFVTAVETVMREAKALAPRQIDEVVEHLRDAYPDDGTVTGTVERLDDFEPAVGAYGVGPQGEPLDWQVARLAGVIVEEIPGEPSQSEGAIDTAIRLLRAAYTEPGPAWPHHDRGLDDESEEAPSPEELRRRAAVDNLASRVHGEGDDEG